MYPSETDGKGTAFPKYPKGCDFLQLLNWHFDVGTRAKDRKGQTWEDHEIANATGLGVRSIKNWRSGQNLPNDLRPILDALFDDSPEHSTWRLELRHAYKKARHNHDSSGTASDPETLIDQYRELVESEWVDINTRHSDSVPDTKSRTHVYLYGWLPATKKEKTTADPEISQRCFEQMVLEFIHYKTRRNYQHAISALCTARYLALVHMVARGAHSGQQTPIDALIDGLNGKPSVHAPGNFDAIDVVRSLGEETDPDRLVTAMAAIFYDLGTEAKAIGVGLGDLLKEESQKHRTSLRKVRENEILRKNEITHKITLLFSDREGQYYEIMQLLSGQVRFNILRSASETLVPGKLAKCALWVCCDHRYLETRIANELERHPDIGDNIYDVQVENA